MTAAAHHACPHCRGTGWVSAVVPDAEIEACALGLREACRVAGWPISGADRVSEAVAATLVGRAPGTLRNWRGEGKGPPHVFLAGRYFYSIADLARWTLENSSQGGF